MADKTMTPAVVPPHNIVGNATSTVWLFDPVNGYDLTHPETPNGPPASNRITLKTTTASIAISPDKTAIVIIDMQNLFLGMGSKRGEGHDAEDALRSFAIPAAEKAGIQIVHITWGISNKQLSVLPPTIFRNFGWDESSLVIDKNSG